MPSVFEVSIMKQKIDARRGHFHGLPCDFEYMNQANVSSVFQLKAYSPRSSLEQLRVRREELNDLSCQTT